MNLNQPRHNMSLCSDLIVSSVRGASRSRNRFLDPTGIGIFKFETGANPLQINANRTQTTTSTTPERYNINAINTISMRYINTFEYHLYTKV